MKRRNFLKAGAVLGASSVLLNAKSFSEKNKLNTLKVMKPAIQNNIKKFELKAVKTSKEIFKGYKTNILSFNENLPVIKVKQGDNVELKYTNFINDDLAIHLHGAHIDGKYDGSPYNNFKHKENFTAKFKIKQQSSTLFMHPHTLHKTGYQNYMDLNAIFIIEDDIKALPKNWGDDDFALILKDKKITRNANFDYRLNMHTRGMGMMGNISLINQVHMPFLKVDKKLIRFRILNASNARIYNLKFSNNMPFSFISSDASLLNEPFKTQKIFLSPSERAQIIVDASLIENKAYLLDENMGNILTVLTNNTKKDNKTLPKILNSLKKPNAKGKEFDFVFTGNMMSGFQINNETMKKENINASFNVGENNIFTIRNESTQIHPFHIHGASFRVIHRQYKNSKYKFLNESGFKDSLVLRAGEMAKISMTFQHKADAKFPFMYHCHNLEHEDMGMMGQFTVS